MARNSGICTKYTICCLQKCTENAAEPICFPFLKGRRQMLWCIQCTHCNENSIHVFLFWELRGLSPNFHFHVSVSDLSIPRIGKHISCRRIGRSIVGIYKSLPDTWMWKLGLWLRNSFSGKICFEFSALFFAVQLYSPYPVPKIYLEGHPERKKHQRIGRFYTGLNPDTEERHPGGVIGENLRCIQRK
jgi:hypothetical protein